MKKGRFSESQILGIIKEGEAGLAVAEICRKYGIGQSTYFAWKAKYSGMTISELKRLKELEAENSRLKRMYAEVCLDKQILKDIVEKKL